METLEHFAKIVLVAHQLGGVGALSSADVQKLMDIRDRLGIRGDFPVCDTREVLKKSACGGEETRPKTGQDHALIENVVRRVMEELKQA